MAELDQAVPEWALAVMTDPQGVQHIVLEISTAGTRFEAVLADVSNYKSVASKLNEGIRRVGAELKGSSSLITVKEMPDGLRPPQGGQQRGPSRPRP